MSENKQEKENVIEAEVVGKKEKTKKMNFFKKVWYSITKFDKYTEMGNEGVARALKYLLQMVCIFVTVIAITGLYDVNKNLNGLVKNIEENIPDFKYENDVLSLTNKEDEAKVYRLEDNNMNFGKIIVDLTTEDESVIAQYEEEIRSNEKNNNIGIIILKDKIIEVVRITEGIESDSRISMTYKEFVEKIFGDSNLIITKSNLIDYLNGTGRAYIFIVNFGSYFIAYFIIYVCSWLVYVLILALIGYITAIISKVKITFANMYSMAIYAFTLSNILNLIYFLLNYFVGITSVYFDIAYMAIAYIYLVTVIFLIKTDFFRKQEENKKTKNEEEGKQDEQEQI